jgi:hypothetical protein
VGRGFDWSRPMGNYILLTTKHLRIVKSNRDFKSTTFGTHTERGQLKAARIHSRLCALWVIKTSKPPCGTCIFRRAPCRGSGEDRTVPG